MTLAENSPSFPMLPLTMQGEAVVERAGVPEAAEAINAYLVDNLEEAQKLPGAHRAPRLGQAALKGFLFGPFRQMKEIGG